MVSGNLQSDMDLIIASKRAFRKQLAAKPIAEKLRIVEELAKRTLLIRKNRSNK